MFKGFYINFHVFPSGGQFFSSRISFFTSYYNFEVNRHEKVGQKREKACNSEYRGGKNCVKDFLKKMRKSFTP